MTIAMFFFVIWLFIYFGRAIVNKKTPTTNVFDTYNDNPPPTPLNTQNFPVGFSLEDPVTYNYFMNESIYTVRAYTYMTIRIPQENGSVSILNQQVPLHLEKCRPDHFGDLAVNFSYIALDQMYCLNKVQPNIDDEIILQGTFESPIYQSIIVDFLQCDNATSNNTCASQEELDKNLEGGYMGLVFPNLALDLTNHKHPIQKYRDGYYTTTGNSYSKDLSITLQELEINTDYGWFTNDYENLTYIKLDSIKEYYIPVSKGYMVTFTIRLSTLNQHFNRTYVKVQDVLAQVYGVATLGFTILFILLAPYARLRFYEALINETFAVRLIRGNPISRSESSNSKDAAQTKEIQMTTVVELEKEQQQKGSGPTETGLSDRQGEGDQKPFKKSQSYREAYSGKEGFDEGIERLFIVRTK